MYAGNGSTGVGNSFRSSGALQNVLGLCFVKQSQGKAGDEALTLSQENGTAATPSHALPRDVGLVMLLDLTDHSILP